MLRAGLLYLSEQKAVFKFVRSNPIAKKLASRFVAGETLDSAVEAVRALNANGVTTSLDLLGESVRTEDEARAAADTAIAMLDRIAADKLQSNISVKLTQLGMDLGTQFCADNTRRLLEKAKATGNFVRVDMEASAYTQTTLDLVEKELFPQYRAQVGTVVQSYLYRTDADIDRLNGLGVRVRLCKGAYKEPANVAYPEKKDVDASYARNMEKLLERGNYPGIATHDEALIARARRFVEEKGIARDRFEFQMLYGVRRDLQDMLIRDGYRLRVYVPFGTQWYPYLMRRLAERPANIAFILGNVVKEGFRR